MSSVWDLPLASPSPRRGEVPSGSPSPQLAPVKRSFVAKVLFERLDEQETASSCTVAVTATGIADLFDGLAEQLKLVAGLHYCGTIAHLQLAECSASRLIPLSTETSKWTHVDRPSDAETSLDGLLLLLPVSFVCYVTWAPRTVTLSVFYVGIGPRHHSADTKGRVLQRRVRCTDCSSVAFLKQAVEAAVQHRISTSRMSFVNNPPVHDTSVLEGSFEPFRHVGQLAPSCCLLIDMTHEGFGTAGGALRVGGVLDALQLRKRTLAAPTLPLDNIHLFVSESQVTTAAAADAELLPNTAAAARSSVRSASGKVSSPAIEGRIDPAAQSSPFHFSFPRSLQTPEPITLLEHPSNETVDPSLYGHRSESPQHERIQNDLAKDMRVELSNRFPIDARTMRPREQLLASRTTGNQQREQPLTPRSQRKALIHVAMQQLMQHKKRDFFTTATLVGLTTNIVTEFSCRYEPQGAPIRFPLGMYDLELLRQVCEDCMRAEVARGTAPFALSGMSVERPTSRLQAKFDEVSPTKQVIEEGFIPDVPPMAAAAPPKPLPSSSVLVLTKPQLDTSRKRLMVYATIAVDIFDNAIVALAAKGKHPGKAYPKSTGTDVPFRWFLRTGPSQMLASSREISLDALFGLGVAESYILSYSVPITVALELDLDPNRDFSEVEHHEKLLVHRYRAGGSIPQPLQEGAQYTVGIEIVRRDVPADSQRVTAVQTFVIPRNYGLAPLSKDELRDILNPGLALRR